jgi:hypothetical protein
MELQALSPERQSTENISGAEGEGGVVVPGRAVEKEFFLDLEIAIW